MRDGTVSICIWVCLRIWGATLGAPKSPFRPSRSIFAPPSLRFAHLDNINYPPDLSPSHDYDKTCLSLQYRVNFRRQNSLCYFFKKYLSLTLTGFCVLKRDGYWHAFFFVQTVPRVCPVSARMSLSWHSQRHCWLLMYVHKTLLGLPPTVLFMEFGIPPFSKVCRMCASASERAVTSHHRSAQVSERYCPTPPHHSFVGR